MKMETEDRRRAVHPASLHAYGRERGRGRVRLPFAERLVCVGRHGQGKVRDETRDRRDDDDDGQMQLT